VGAKAVRDGRGLALISKLISEFQRL
jgi:hypothetical protein